MELNHLKYFYFVAKEGGFTRASRALRIAQPAITKTVKRLEADLGTLLFERTGKTVRLTKAGNDVYRKCEVIFGHVDDINRMHQHGTVEELSGALNMGAAEPVASFIVPAVLERLLKTSPRVYPQTIATSATEAVRLLVAKRIELALLFHAPELPESVEMRTLYPTTYKLVVLAAKARNDAVCSSFIGSREVDDDANKVYPTLTKLRRIHPGAEIKVSTNSLSAHRQLVLAGMGVAILPEFMVREDLKAKRLACLLKDEEFRFNMKLVVRRGEFPSPAAEAFLKELPAVLATL